MEIKFEEQPSEKEIAFLEQQLLNLNCSKVDGYSYENFIIKGIDSTDETIAGIHGQIGGGWLYIAGLWVAENHRGNGIGQKFLFQAEKVASGKKYHGAYLYTYSFQSPAPKLIVQALIIEYKNIEVTIKRWEYFRPH